MLDDLGFFALFLIGLTGLGQIVGPYMAALYMVGWACFVPLRVRFSGWLVSAGLASDGRAMPLRCC